MASLVDQLAGLHVIRLADAVGDLGLRGPSQARNKARLSSPVAAIAVVVTQ